MQGLSVRGEGPDVTHCSQEGRSGLIRHIFHVTECLEQVINII